MKIDNMYLAGIGTADVDTTTTAEAVDKGWYDPTEHQHSGLLSITTAGDTPAPDLAIQAARRALTHSAHHPTDIAAVLHTNVHPQGPDGWSAPHYINHNTINQPVTSLEIRNGCAGLFSTLTLATTYLHTTGHPAALITAADNFNTPAINRWNTSKLFILADGGAALILSQHHGFARLLATNSTSNPALEERHRGDESLFPPGLTVGRKLNFDQRTEYFRKRLAAGLQLPAADFSSTLIDVVETTLKEADTSAAEVKAVIHDGYAHDALHDLYLDPLGIEHQRGIWEYTRRVGHAGPVDQIRGLEYAWTHRGLTVGDKVLLVSDAPGMEAASAVVEVTQAR
jgi:3-oxoacyl-[acyl-carrier-protein] synthase III